MPKQSITLSVLTYQLPLITALHNPNLIMSTPASSTTNPKITEQETFKTRSGRYEREIQTLIADGQTKVDDMSANRRDSAKKEEAIKAVEELHKKMIGAANLVISHCAKIPRNLDPQGLGKGVAKGILTSLEYERKKQLDATVSDKDVRGRFEYLQNQVAGLLNVTNATVEKADKVIDQEKASE